MYNFINKSLLNSSPTSVFIFFGNCQSHYLASIFAAASLGPVFIVGKPFGFHPTFLNVEPVFIEENEVDAVTLLFHNNEVKIYYFLQISPFVNYDNYNIPKFVNIIKFPYIEIQSFWPHLSTVNSSPIIDTDILKRRLDFDLFALSKSCKLSDKCSLFDFISSNLDKSFLFYTFNHFDRKIFIFLLNLIVIELNELDRNKIISLFIFIEKDDGISFISDHPIHLKIIQSLNLEWADSGYYKNWVLSLETIRNTSNFETAKNYLLEALSFDDCIGHVWYSYAQVCRVLNDKNGQLMGFHNCYKLYPDNKEYAKEYYKSLVKFDDHDIVINFLNKSTKYI
jgi:hypothetical protein